MIPQLVPAAGREAVIVIRWLPRRYASKSNLPESGEETRRMAYAQTAIISQIFSEISNKILEGVDDIFIFDS